jgi:hypothetical protein
MSSQFENGLSHGFGGVLPSLHTLNAFVEQSERCWSDMLHGKSTAGERMEVGAEAVAVALAATVTGGLLSRMGPTAEPLLPEMSIISGRESLAEADLAMSDHIRSGEIRVMAGKAVLRSIIEKDPHMGSGELAIMALHEDPALRLAVAEHPNVDQKTLGWLAHDARSGIK